MQKLSELDEARRNFYKKKIVAENIFGQFVNAFVLCPLNFNRVVIILIPYHRLRAI